MSEPTTQPVPRTERVARKMVLSPELQAMGDIEDTLNELSDRERARVVAWLGDKFDMKAVNS